MDTTKKIDKSARLETEKSFFVYCYNGKTRFFDSKKEVMQETGLGYKQIAKCIETKMPFWYSRENNMATLHCRQDEIRSIVRDEVVKEVQKEKEKNGVRVSAKIIAFDVNGAYFHFASINEASKTLGINSRKINKAINSGNFADGYCFDYELDN